MNTAEWIGLAIVAACAVGTIWCAKETRRHAKTAQAAARRAKAANRQAWGTLAEMQRRQLRNRT